jgi:acetoin utilization protein AcuB
MLVKNWMSEKPITVDVNDSMQHAMTLMKENKIRMLPVLEKGKLVGIITDTDLKRASASDATTLDVHELLYLISKIKVENIMTKDPLTVTPDLTMEETAEILIKNNISGAPVVNEKNELMGIITRNDLFRMLISLSGFGKKGIQFAFQLEDRPGSIREVTDIIRSYGGRIASILGSYDRSPEGYRNVHIRAFDVDRQKLPELKEELKRKASMLYMVDHRENTREIYS